MNTTVTTTTSTIETSTSAIVQNVIISTSNEILPTKTSHIIVLAIVIPFVWIAFIIILVWIKKSGGSLGSIYNSSNSGQTGEQSVSFELNNVSDA
jgi:hypothetical protein